MSAIDKLGITGHTIGLSNDLRLFTGHDTSHDILDGTDHDEYKPDDALHPSDAVAIADAMLNRWQRFRAIHAARVDLVPPINTEETAG